MRQYRKVLTLRLAHSKHSPKDSCCYNIIIAITIVFAIPTSCIHCLNLVWNLCSMPWESNDLTMNDKSPTHGEREHETFWWQQEEKHSTWGWGFWVWAMPTS